MKGVKTHLIHACAGTTLSMHAEQKQKARDDSNACHTNQRDSDVPFASIDASRLHLSLVQNRFKDILAPIMICSSPFRKTYPPINVSPFGNPAALLLPIQSNVGRNKSGSQ